MSGFIEPRYSNEHLLEDHGHDPIKTVSHTTLPARSCLCHRPGKIITSLLALAAFLTAIEGWRLFGQSEQKPASDELAHRSMCSTYPGDCEKVAPYVFDSIYSLLKQWPSSFAPNGHSVVPATVGPNTLLYHAKKTLGKPKPKDPTFFAFDAEMSLGIFGSSGTANLYTMTTTRELRAIYLDGHSATLTETGTLDSQMAILGNYIPENPYDDLTYNEDKRAVELCQLANQLNIDAVVRMNAGFEIIICDSSKAGIRELFVMNITVPVTKSRDPSLPRDPHRQPPLGYGNDFAEQNGWEWIRSSTWHYGNGITGGLPERRVRLNLCQVVSWYDPSLRSLIESHNGDIRANDTYENGWGLRRGHRLLGASTEDIKTFHKWLKRATSEAKNLKCSHTDWQALIETIFARYNSRAREILFYLEKDPPDAEGAHQVVNSVYTLSHALLSPYLEYPVVAGVTKPEAKSRTLARCNAAYVGHIELDSLSEFEVLIKESTQVVVSRLCEWAWNIFEWTDGQMHNRLQQSLLAPTTSSDEIGHMIRQGIAHQKDKTRDLLKWIGWDIWQDCENKCAPNELCYIPMWPVIYAPGKKQGGIYAGSKLSEEETVEFWKPKCLSRRDFDCGGGRAREPQYQFPDVPYETCRSLQRGV